MLGLDPGETTGICIMEGSALIKGWQLNTKNIPDAVSQLEDVIEEYRPKIIAYEDYRVYAWESDKHKWANLHTPKWIGAIIATGYFTGVPTTCRMAQEAKGFVTDDKLRDWGMYQKGLRHSRDAIRHAIYYLVFGSKD